MIDLLDLIQQDVALTKRGKDWWGLCPFHTEKTPSFSVSGDAQLYYCFSCQVGGDSISWLRNYRKLSFHEAVRIVGKDLSPYPLPSHRQRQAEADTLRAYYEWEHRERRKWAYAYRALLADQLEAEIGYRATRRCSDLYAEEEKEAWVWRLVEVNLALEMWAIVPTMADIFTYDEHRQGRFMMWQKERGGGA